MPCLQASFPGLLCFIFTIHESERAVKTIVNVNWRTNKDTLNKGNISIPFYRVMPCSSITATNSIDRSSQRLDPGKLSADMHGCHGWPGFGGRVVTLGSVQVWTIRSTHCIDHTLRCEPRGGKRKGGNRREMKGEKGKGEIKVVDSWEFSFLTFTCTCTQSKSLGVHIWDGGPLVSANVKLFPTPQGRNSVKPTNCIE